MRFFCSHNILQCHSGSANYAFSVRFASSLPIKLRERFIACHVKLDAHGRNLSSESEQYLLRGGKHTVAGNSKSWRNAVWRNGGLSKARAIENFG